MEREHLVKSAQFAGGTFLVSGMVDLLGHLGPTGLVIGGIASYVAWRHGDEVMERVRDLWPQPQEPKDVAPVQRVTGKRSMIDRALGRYPQEQEAEQSPTLPLPKMQRELEIRTADDDDIEMEAMFYDDDDELAPPPLLSSTFLFSSLLEQGFVPSLNHIYIGTTYDGEHLFCQAKDLCHVALAGSTGNGKTSLLRMLMAQLCKAGAQVLLLNPHHTRYDIESGEDWTPFDRYLMHDAMECRRYEMIAHYLKNAATVLLPKRLDRRAASQPYGKPYFIVLDELPAIVDHIKEAPEWLAPLLKEGRKVGIFLISASQDFLVKTIAPNNGGAIRDNYRTAYYSGGDATTAHTLLDMPARDVPEDQLGKGVVMLRCAMVPEVKKARCIRVPFLDNAALYRLLGPSSYVPHSEPVSDVEFDRLMTEVNNRPDTDPMDSRYAVAVQQPIAAMPALPTVLIPEPNKKAEEVDMRYAILAWNAGNNSVRKIGAYFDLKKNQAEKLVALIKASGKASQDEIADEM